MGATTMSMVDGEELWAAASRSFGYYGWTDAAAEAFRATLGLSHQEFGRCWKGGVDGIFLELLQRRLWHLEQHLVRIAACNGDENLAAERVGRAFRHHVDRSWAVMVSDYTTRMLRCPELVPPYSQVWRCAEESMDRVVMGREPLRDAVRNGLDVLRAPMSCPIESWEEWRSAS